MNWAAEPRELTIRERSRVRGMGYRRECRWLRPSMWLPADLRWAIALAWRLDQDLRDQHICMKAMSSMNCGACNRGVPYPHESVEDMLAGMR